ncbi:MAG: lipopolysaccharide biosynthesis protein [Ruminococcus sp.]|uniref:YveK family protein n=1 Tax=Ruminococcus sp. TaxID=41978 RepID=UPI0025DE54E0|nr:Wzz/FepE/Etk N-terminal domain-containing protein [Ruminococcus sp.]MBR0528428.1 lipopolysaccharide biosynthesis protein [Ruminococcus sp.]
MEGKEISIQEILGIVLAHIRLIIIITVIAGVAGYSYAKFVLPLQYTSSIKIYVTNGVRNSNDDDDDNELINGADINTARSLAATYIVILDDTSVYEAISDRLLEDYKIEDLRNYFTVATDEKGKEYIPTGQIKRLITIAAVNNTEVLQVTVTSEVPNFSADICSYISDIAPDMIIRTTKAGYVETVSPPKVPTSPSGPNIMRYLLLGLVAGLVISVGIVLVANFFDNTVKSGEEIKERFGVPVLAEIPDIFMDEKGGSSKYGKY